MLRSSAIGKSSLPRLVFLHGFLGCKEDWIEVAQELQDFCCHLIDLPGHGDSPLTEDVLESIRKILNVLKPRCLIGYSMGGRLALQTSFSPSIIISAHLGLKSASEREERWKKDLEWIEMLETKPLDIFLEAWYGQPLFDSLRSSKNFASVLRRRLKQNPQHLIAMLKKCSLAHQKVQKPSAETFFLYGEKDLKYAEHYRTLRSFAVKKSGHAAHLENPKECARFIYELVKGK